MISPGILPTREILHFPRNTPIHAISVVMYGIDGTTINAVHCHASGSSISIITSGA